VRTVVVLAGLLVAATAAAQNAYRYVTPDGRVIYSDMPVPGARLDATITPPAPASAPAAGFTPSPGQEALLKSAEERVRRLNELTIEIQNLESHLRAADARLEAGREPLEGERTGIVYQGRSRLSDAYWARQDDNQRVVADINARLNRAVQERNALR
jgi:hypothetical protein